MISLDSHGPYFLNPRVIPILLLISLPSFYKQKIATIFVPFKVIMVGEFQNKKLNSFCENRVFITIFLLLELPNKMGLLKGKLGLLKSLQEPQLQKTQHQSLKFLVASILF